MSGNKSTSSKKATVASKSKQDKTNNVSNKSPRKAVKKKIKEKSENSGVISLTITSTKGGLWLIQGEGYIYNLVKGIENDDERLQDKNYYGKVFQRMSFENDTPKKNEKGFWKFFILKQNEENIEDTFENRIDHLVFCKNYLQNHDENIYNNQYEVNMETADKTPKELKALDHYLLSSSIVEYVKTLYEIEGDDTTWARSNKIEKD